MSVRQFAFCITIGPVLLFWFLVGVIGIFPLLIVIGWLAGEKQPVSVAWDICMVSPIEMLKEGYRGPAS